MQPDEVEEYENGNIGLIVHRWHNPLSVKYWIKGGIGVIEFAEDDFYDLLDLLMEYDNEMHFNKKPSMWREFVNKVRKNNE